MGLGSFFKKNVIDKVFINEASGTDVDTSFAKGTIKDNLSGFFRGMTSGVMIPSALTGGKIPTWNGADITYPFVGIVGYSDHAAASVVSNRAKGNITDFFSALSSDSTISGILHEVESRCIPNDIFIFYPDVPIESIGQIGSSRSLNLFFPTVLTAAAQSKLGKYSVQQCLDLDDNGKLYVNPSANHSTVFIPRGKGSKYSALAVSKMTMNDLLSIVERIGGKHELVDMLSLAFKSFLSKAVIDANGGNTIPNNRKESIDKFNPNAGKFLDFFKEINPKLTDEVISKYLKENPNALFNSFVKWLNTNSEQTICEKLLSKYYFPIPFEKAYCMRSLGDMANQSGVDYDRVKKDYDVFVACINNSNPDSIQEILKSVHGENDSSENDVDYNIQTDSSSSSISPDGEFDSYDMKKTLMDLCRMVSSGNTTRTMCFKIRDDVSQQSREDDTVIQRHEGTKRTFIRLLYAGAVSKNKYDDLFLNNNTGSFDTRPFTLDYTELFIRFRNQLNKAAPQKFNCQRISGYTITFEYDSDIESAHKREEANYFSNLLDAYSEKSTPINEPSSFNMVYFKDGDFISSGYEKPNNMLVEMGADNLPYVLRNDKKGVQEDRIRSYFVYAKQHINTISSSNLDLIKTIPKRYSIDSRIIDRLSKKADAEDAAATNKEQTQS